MSENDKPENDELFPKLLHIPVYREDYISQERVDALCELLWTEKQEQIIDLVDIEKNKSFPDSSRGSPFPELMDDIASYLHDLEDQGKIDKISMIAMIDLSYEITCRIRHMLSLENIPPQGKPIAESPEEPFPVLIDLPVDNTLRGVTQELADEFSHKMYDLLNNEHPMVLYSFCEAERRYLFSNKPYWTLIKIQREMDFPFMELDKHSLLLNFMGRLRKMIGRDIENLEKVLREFNKDYQF